MTDGALLREALTEPIVDDYSVKIIDEAPSEKSVLTYYFAY